MEKFFHVTQNKNKYFKGRIPRVYSFKRRPPLFLFSLVCCMTFLIGISVYSAIYIDYKLNILEKKIKNSITIQIPGTYGESKESHNFQVSRVINLIKTNPKISKYDIISNQESISLLEPWLGKNSLPDDIIIPSIINLRINELNSFNYSQLEKKIKNISPTIKIFKNIDFIQPNLNTIKTIKIISLTVVGISVICLIFITITSAKAIISLNFKTVELLHLIGARKNYIAKEFVLQNLILIISTTIFGLFISYIFIIFIGSIYFEDFYTDIMNALFKINYIFIIIFLPLFLSSWSSLITYITVIKNLKRLP